MTQHAEYPTTNIEDRLSDEQREKIRAIDTLGVGAYSRAMCVLVALEIKPATEVDVFEWNTELSQVQSILEGAGLKVVQRENDASSAKLARLVVSKDQQVIDEMLLLSPTSDHRRYGELMGFTKSMIDAFERKIERLPDEEIPKEIATQIFEPKLSREHIAEEMQLLRQWEQAVKKYAPTAYQELQGKESRRSTLRHRGKEK